MCDVRKPAELVVKDKLTQVVRECFEVRAQVEKKMTRQELASFDRVLAKYLQKDKLLPKLKEACQQDYNLIDQTKSLVNYDNDRDRDKEVQGMKFKHDQRRHNKSIKDEDAFYKGLSYASMREKHHIENMKN